MKNWFKKNKWTVIVSVFVLAMLAFSFWYGGSAPGARGWSVMPRNTTTTETEAVGEPHSSKTPQAQTSAEDEAPETAKDAYLTDPTPAGKPAPVEPQNGGETGAEAANPTASAETGLTCTISISCKTILDNMSLCDPAKAKIVPEDGWILNSTAVPFTEGESVFDILQRVCQQKGIQMESKWVPIYNSAYIEGIDNLYDFDVGENSGWMYKVNGWFPNYGCSRYCVKSGNTIDFVYTCDQGNDVGGGSAVR